jgi:hypothetical protein
MANDECGMQNESQSLVTSAATTPRRPFRPCANTAQQRVSIFTKGQADVLDHATSEMAIGSKLCIDATKKLSGEGFNRP